MDAILDRIGQLSEADIGFENLGKVVAEFDFNSTNYQDHVAAEEPGTYSRNILTLDPIEVLVITWPAGVDSAIHHHKGFYGYVAVVEGAINNVEYDFKDNKISVTNKMTGSPGEFMAEEQGVIHMLANASDTEKCVTIHFYYPALKDLDNVRIFDLDRKAIGILNEKAKACSWSEPSDSFKTIEENAFEVVG